MTPTPPLPPPASLMTPEQRRGRALLLSIFTISVLIDFAIIVIKVIHEGFAGSLPSCIRVCLSIALMYAIFIGQRWARWLFVTLMYSASILMLLVVISRPYPLLIALLVLFALGGSLVGFDAGIVSFLKYQREVRP